MGLLRLFLALSVIAGHAATTVFGFNGIGAWYAVNFFFIISGFYMAMVLNEKYRDTKPIYFYISRALRIFPTYYVGLILSLLVSFGFIVDFFNHLSLGTKFFFLFQNIFIFGQDLSYLVCAKTTSLECASPIGLTINPPAWSLAVELGFYLVAPFIVKSRMKTFLFILFGCAYLLALNRLDFPLNSIAPLRPNDLSEFNYYFYPSSFIFFGGGALAYHLSKKDAEPHYFYTVLTLLALSFTTTIMPFWQLLFIGMAIPVLFKYTANNRLDRMIGEMSFPAYILHFPVLLFLRPLTQSHPQYFKLIGLGSWVALISCTIGLLIYVFLEKRINIFRASEIFMGKNGKPAVANSRSKSTRLSLVASALFFLFPVVVMAHIYASQRALSPTASDTTYNLTDANWVNGVSRRDAGFFVSNTSRNLSQFQIGGKVVFRNGDVRKIIRSDIAGPYLNVYVEGNPLNGLEVGFPQKLTVEK